MNTLEEIAAIRQQLTDAMQRLDALEQKPQEVPPVWFKPKDGEEYAIASQNEFGKWHYAIEEEIGPFRCTHPVLHPYHAERYCEAMNTLALLRAESDEVVEGKRQWIVDKEEICSIETTCYKYKWSAGITKNSKEALEALLTKHNVTPATVAKMLRFVNGDKTAGDW